jgi:hypothetical protein
MPRVHSSGRRRTPRPGTPARSPARSSAASRRVGVAASGQIGEHEPLVLREADHEASSPETTRLSEVLHTRSGRWRPHPKARMSNIASVAAWRATSATSRSARPRQSGAQNPIGRRPSPSRRAAQHARLPFGVTATAETSNVDPTTVSAARELAVCAPPTGSPSVRSPRSPSVHDQTPIANGYTRAIIAPEVAATMPGKASRSAGSQSSEPSALHP